MHRPDLVVRLKPARRCQRDLHFATGECTETTAAPIVGRRGRRHRAGGRPGGADGRNRRSRACSCVVIHRRAPTLCRYCPRSRWRISAWPLVFGHTIDSIQAESRGCRWPTTPLQDPRRAHGRTVICSPTSSPTSWGWVLNGMVSPGDVVAIVGAGPIGLAAILTAKLHTTARRGDQHSRQSAAGGLPLRSRRRHQQRRGGCQPSEIMGDDKRLTADTRLRGGVERTAFPHRLRQPADQRQPRASVTVRHGYGLFGLGELECGDQRWPARNWSTRRQRVDPLSVELIVSGRLDPSLSATHRFAMEDTMSACGTFADAADTGALKVVRGRRLGRRPSELRPRPGSEHPRLNRTALQCGGRFELGVFREVEDIRDRLPCGRRCSSSTRLVRLSYRRFSSNIL